jgi:hypothetical protein
MLAQHDEGERVLRRSTLGLAAIAALALALPATPAWAGMGPFWNCQAFAGGGPVPPAHFPRWRTKAEARENTLRACRRAGGGNRCKIVQCWRESGNPRDAL